MVSHSAFCRSIKYDYMNSLTWAILKKTQILNGCETFAFKYIICFVEKKIFLRFCLCIFESDTVKDDCPI